MPSLVILGAGGHAKVVADAARLGGWTVAGFVDERLPDRTGESFAGATILDSNTLHQPSPDIAVALGIGDCNARLAAARRLRALRFELPTIVHPRAILSPKAVLGPGTQLLAGAIVNPDARLGIAVIVNTGATVDHDCRIADGVHLAPGVHLAGSVSIGEGTLMGIGSVVKPGVQIGERCVVGAGSVVLYDLPDGVSAYGVPAKPV